MDRLSFTDSHISDKEGSMPGSLTYIGETRDGEPTLHLYRYNEEKLSQIPLKTVAALTQQDPGEEEQVDWLNIEGIHQVELIKELGHTYHLHPLILEDIVNTTQRPKIEEYTNGIYLVLRMIFFQEESQQLTTEQVSLFLGNNLVLTFQEKPEDVFEPIRKRLEEKIGRIRKKGADYLFYALLDAIISNYFTVLERIEDEIDDLEESFYQTPDKESINEIQQLKKSLIFLRKSIGPMREVMNQLVRIQESSFFEEKNFVFVRDLQGELFQVIDLVDTYRDVLSNLYDLHFALNNQRMNETVRLLTVVSTLFIPLTFLAGIYGMNFQYMPELQWRYGYFFIWGLMLALVCILLVYFKRKSWI